MTIIAEAAIRCDSFDSFEAYFFCMMQIYETLRKMKCAYIREEQMEKIFLPEKVREEAEKALEHFAPGHVTLHLDNNIMYFCRQII